MRRFGGASYKVAEIDRRRCWREQVLSENTDMSATEKLLAGARGHIVDGRAAIITVESYGAPFEVTSIREVLPHTDWRDDPIGKAERLLQADLRDGSIKSRTFPLTELRAVRPGGPLP